MKALSLLIMLLHLVFCLSGLQNVWADQADEDCETGRNYYHGFGVERDYTEALKWFRKAAHQGNAPAQNNIGAMYRHGEGVKRDYSAALKWFRKAADKGFTPSQDLLEKWSKKTGQ